MSQSFDEFVRSTFPPELHDTILTPVQLTVVDGPNEPVEVVPDSSDSTISVPGDRAEAIATSIAIRQASRAKQLEDEQRCKRVLSGYHMHYFTVVGYYNARIDTVTILNGHKDNPFVSSMYDELDTVWTISIAYNQKTLVDTTYIEGYFTICSPKDHFSKREARRRLAMRVQDSDCTDWFVYQTIKIPRGYDLDGRLPGKLAEKLIARAAIDEMLRSDHTPCELRKALLDYINNGAV